MDYGKNLKLARKWAGITQAELAKRAGIATITIRQYEAGKRTPNIDVWFSLADALNLSLEELNNAELLPTVPFNPETILDEIKTDCVEHKQIAFNVTPDPEYAALEKKLENGTITRDELRKYKDLTTQGFANAHKTITAAMERLEGYMSMLNDDGQQKAVERVEELTEIPKYQRQPPQDDPQTPAESTSPAPTKNPPAAPQQPPEDEESR